jgi:hypothetical protein
LYGRRVDLDVAPGNFDVVDFDNDMKSIGWRAQGQRFPLPLVIEDPNRS